MTAARERYCRTCGGVTVAEPPPDGWYNLSVNDRHAPNGKYRYIGLYCSIVCLVEALPEMARVEAIIRKGAA